ncbi:MAG: sporulation protein [Acidimicrobiales bacterium]|nr:sporulation protein [Acidimicrobiales bacterium]
MLVSAAIPWPAAGAAPAKPAKPPPAPARGWVVDKVRFEAVDQAMPLTAQGQGDYRGAIEVRSASGGLATIDDVALEDYVRGIAEVPPNWPAEALKAQAIAARTYALHQLASTVSTPFRAAGANICATDGCQVYVGVDKERQQGSAGWLAAVRATAGQAVLANGAPIFAEYSSSNGGRTVGGSYPYLRSVPDPDDAASPLHHWKYTMPVSALAGVLGVTPPATLVSANRANDRIVFQVHQPAPTAATPPAPQPGQPPPPPDPAPAQPPPTTQTMSAGDFRAKANGGGVPAPPGLPLPFPSDRFALGTSGDTVTVDGGGWGHGVGMSQWGAYGKAQRGMKAADILAAYYGGLRPVTLPAAQLPASIRVALALDQSSVTVTGPGRFRVVDGAGNPLALIALGRWQMTPAGSGKVRVVPPEGYDQPLAITPGALEPVAPVAGAPATLHYRVSTPAAVKVTMVAPGAQPVTVDAGVVDAGEATQQLPVAALGGAYQVVIQADAGPGRQTTVPYVFSVAGPARLVVPSAALLAAPRGEALWTRTVAVWRSFPSRPPLVLAAFLLLANAALLGAMRVLSRRTVAAHID